MQSRHDVEGVLLQFWDRSKRLREGGLVCLLSNHPEPSMIFATINMREPARFKSLKHSATRYCGDKACRCCISFSSQWLKLQRE